MLALFAVALVTPTPVIAADDDEDAIEEVVVTGSRVKRSNFTSSSPITVISGQSILESGFGDLGEALRNQVTSGTAGFNQSSILSGGGATSVDLRNLGTSRVLVLINGKRVASFADALANQAADLTFVPNALVDRVDILRDGASAVYGSDAISGVINIILKERFEGVEAGVSSGISGEGDAERYSANFAMGTTSDRGSLMMGGEYRYQNNLPQVDRDWAFPNITSLNAGGTNNGSFFSPGGVFLADAGGGFCTEPRAFGGDEVTDIFPNCPSFRGQTSPDELARYDYGLEQDIFNASKILSTAAYGVYEVADGIEAFLEVEYAKRRSEFNLDGNPGSTGTPSYPAGWRVPASNPNNGLGAGNYYVRPSSTIGIRANTAESDTVRVVAGLRGEVVSEESFLDGWSWELSWLYTRVDADNITNSTWNLARANIISDPDLCAADQICAATVNPSGALDVFRPGNWTQDEIFYLRQNTLATAEFQTSGWFGSMTGPIAELPAGEVQVAFGFETRTEEGFVKPDSVTEAGESVANQTFTTSGSFTVDEFFAELDVPLVRDVPGVQSLDLNAQYRWSDYDTFGSEDVYRFGANWQISDDLRVRASISTAYRAPQITDLFGGGTVSFDFFSHPCSDAGATGDVAANCALDGIPLGTPQLAGQFAVLSGSNQALLPETADTASIGLIFTPSFLEGFSFALDYWDIEVENLIGRNTSDSVVDACYEGPAGLTAPECAQFNTNLSATGTSLLVQNLVNQLSNLDSVSTDGFDLNIGYEFDGFAGTIWNIDLQGTYVKENTFAPGQGGTDDRGSIPRIVANANATVDWEQWDFRWGIRYIHGTKDPRFDGNNVLNYDGPPSHTEHDMRVSYNWDRYRATFGVNDVFDNDPPYVFSTGNNTDLFLYNAIGRYMFLRLNATL
ncbi:MAG: TonB-dependent receptor plug domain-containing protein [Pseudomonadales bacterium]